MDPVSIALDLMSIDSTSGSESAVIALTEELLSSRGWTVTRIPVSPGRDNIYARHVEDSPITLSTHLDTVPPFIPPRLDGDRPPPAPGVRE